MAGIYVLALSLILQLITTSGLQMLSFFEPGSHILTPEDYQYSDTLLIEIWGAGGGANPCREWVSLCAGGGSGAYVKAHMKANNLTFNITVGKGGKGGYGDYLYFPENSTSISTGHEGFPGENTYIQSTDPDISVNIIVGGGYEGDIGGLGGVIRSVRGASSHLAIDGQKFQYMYHPSYQQMCHGGNAP